MSHYPCLRDYTQVLVFLITQLSLVVPSLFLYLMPCLSHVLCGSLFYVTSLVFPCFLPVACLLFCIACLDFEPCLF